MRNRKDKKNIFLNDPRERKAESRPEFNKLPFARNTNQSFAKC